MTMTATSAVRLGRPRRVPGWWPGALAWGLWVLAMVRLRQQVDLDALRAELLAVVETTMQPTRASLWLRRDP
jgi:hypothetical protein